MNALYIPKLDATVFVRTTLFFYPSFLSFLSFIQIGKIKAFFFPLLQIVLFGNDTSGIHPCMSVVELNKILYVTVERNLMSQFICISITNDLLNN